MNELAQLINDAIREYRRVKHSIRGATVSKIDTQTVGEFVAEAIREKYDIGRRS